MNDYISREYLLDVLLPHSWHGTNKNIVPYNDRRGYRQRDREIREVIINAPSADVRENVTGEWIYDKAIENWRCSKCNETPKTLGYVGTDDFMREHFKFCNHCGADMRGE